MITTIWVLSWDIRNGNEPTGSRCFTTEALAIVQALKWCDGDYGPYSAITAARKLKKDGVLTLSEDREYRTTSDVLRSEVE